VLSVDLLTLKPICWKRAAILHRYLARKGINSRIHFGVRNNADGAVSGHAWLESGGTAVLESQPPDYVVTYSFPE
jgi:Transglutaminase-like superfamily